MRHAMKSGRIHQPVLLLLSETSPCTASILPIYYSETVLPPPINNLNLAADLHSSSLFHISGPQPLMLVA